MSIQGIDCNCKSESCVCAAANQLLVEYTCLPDHFTDDLGGDAKLREYCRQFAVKLMSHKGKLPTIEEYCADSSKHIVYGWHMAGMTSFWLEKLDNDPSEVRSAAEMRLRKRVKFDCDRIFSLIGKEQCGSCALVEHEEE